MKDHDEARARLIARLGAERVYELATFSAREISQVTGISYEGILAEIHSGRLPAKKIQGRFLVTRHAYEAWLEPD